MWFNWKILNNIKSLLIARLKGVMWATFTIAPVWVRGTLQWCDQYYCLTYISGLSWKLVTFMVQNHVLFSEWKNHGGSIPIIMGGQPLLIENQTDDFVCVGSYSRWSVQWQEYDDDDEHSTVHYWLNNRSNTIFKESQVSLTGYFGIA